MATKKTAKKAAPKPAAKAGKAAGKAPRRETRERSPGMGDNLGAIRKAAVPVLQKLFELQEQMESDMGGYRSDFNDIYENGANEIGCKKAVLMREWKRALRLKREADAEADMDAAERDQTDAFRGALVGTQFEMFTTGDLAPASKTAKERDKAADKEAAAKAADAARDVLEGEEANKAETVN